MPSANTKRNDTERDCSARDPEQPMYKRILGCLGPGLITGASDDDPGGIATYSIAGASLGYTPLWLAFVTLPLMSAVQFSCAKIGLVSKRGLAGVLREHYPRPLLYAAVCLLFFANTLNVGADIAAVSEAINLLVPVNKMLCVFLLGAVLLVFQIAGSYKSIAKILKWLTMALFAYIATAFFVKVDFHAVLKNSFFPEFNFTKDWITTAVAILGTTISPYLFFWQANQEVEELKCKNADEVKSQGKKSAQLRLAAVDVIVGMVFSNLVMYFIILTCAASLHAHGNTDIKSATDAAKALEPLAGQWSELLFASGIIGTGLLAIPILTSSAAYAIAEAFSWRADLDAGFSEAKHFYVCIIVSTVIGMLFNIFGMNAMSALFWSAVINGLASPPLLLLIMLIVNNKKVMGAHANGLLTNILGWVTTIAMTIASVAMFVQK